VVLGSIDRTLDRAFQRATNAFKHSVKGGQLPNRLIINGDGHLAEHAEHGALTH